MKTYLLSIVDDVTEQAVHAALADLLRKRLVTLESEEGLPVLAEADVERDVVRARQQAGVSLAEAKARFGL